MTLKNSKKVLIVSTVGLIALAGCKTRTTGSSAKDAQGQGQGQTSNPPVAVDPCSDANQIVDFIPVDGVGYIATAYASSGLQFRKMTKTGDVCPSNTAGTKDRVVPFSQTNGITIKINNGVVNIPQNNDVDYGYRTSNPVNCADAGAIIGVPASAFASGEQCTVRLDVEDQSWYGITVHSVSAKSNYDTQADANVAFLKSAMTPVGSTNSINNPLVPMKQVNAEPDPAVLPVMEMFYKKYQNSGPPHTARNTCLRNARAAGWLDLQAHFYCMLPYGGERTCYSGTLIRETDSVKNAKTALEKIQILMKAFDTSFKTCFAPGAPYDFMKTFGQQDGVVVSNAFKYVMFVKQGVMDFNIEAENNLINTFYSKINEPRATRLLDPETWTADQMRYGNARASQVKLIKLGMAKKQCADSGKTWDDSTNTCK